MIDPWAHAISQLQGTAPLPVVAWPQHLRCVVIARDLSALEEEPEPLPTEPRCAVVDEALLTRVRAAGTASVRQIAAAANLPKTSAARALTGSAQLA